MIVDVSVSVSRKKRAQYGWNLLVGTKKRERIWFRSKLEAEKAAAVILHDLNMRIEPHVPKAKPLRKDDNEDADDDTGDAGQVSDGSV